MLGQLIVLTLYSLDSAVYTPEDGGNWMLAKLNVQITDLGYAQIVEHLAKVMIFAVHVSYLPVSKTRVIMIMILIINDTDNECY